MSIIFAQPEPVSPAYGQGSAADVITKDLPTMAHLLEAYRHVGGGGGGGGDTQNYAVPQEPSYRGGGGGGGAFLGDVAPGARQFYQGDQPDYVSEHLAQQHAYRMEQQQQQAAAQAALYSRLNPQAQQSQPPPEWTTQDKKDLDEAVQAQSAIEQKYSENPQGSDAPQKWQAAQQKITSLRAKKQAADEAAQGQNYQAASKAMAQQRALFDTDYHHAVQTGIRQVPDLPAPVYNPVTGHMINEVEYKAAAAAKEKALEWNAKLPEIQMKRQAHELEMDHKAQDHYLTIYKDIEKDELKYDQDAKKEFLKKHPDGEFKDITGDELHKRIQDALKRRDLPPTLKEYMAQQKAERNPQAVQGGQLNGQISGQNGQAPRIQIDPALAKNADPQVVQSMAAHVSAMPKTEGGAINLKAATIPELKALLQYYQNPSKIGITDEEAAKARGKIGEESARRGGVRRPSEPGGMSFEDFTILPAARAIGRNIPSPGRVARDVMALPGQMAQVPYAVNNELGAAVRGLGADAIKATNAAKQAAVKAGQEAKGPYEDFKKWLRGD